MRENFLCITEHEGFEAVCCRLYTCKMVERCAFAVGGNGYGNQLIHNVVLLEHVHFSCWDELEHQWTWTLVNSLIFHSKQQDLS